MLGRHSSTLEVSEVSVANLALVTLHDFLRFVLLGERREEFPPPPLNLLVDGRRSGIGRVCLLVARDLLFFDGLVPQVNCLNTVAFQVRVGLRLLVQRSHLVVRVYVDVVGLRSDHHRIVIVVVVVFCRWWLGRRPIVH